MSSASASVLKKYGRDMIKERGMRRRRFIVGTLAVGLVGSFQHKFKECVDVTGNQADITYPYTMFWIRVPFGRTRSRFVGLMMEKPLPVSFREPLYKTYAWFYGANLDEVRFPLDSYHSLQDFFDRNLKDGARPIADSTLVSPSDSVLKCYGEITEENERIPMIKDATYNVRCFLGADPIVNRELPSPEDALGRRIPDDPSTGKKGSSLKYAVLYLGPGDCHRVFSPCKLKVHEGMHFAGEALPLFNWLLTRLNDVFTVNERVVLNGTWEHGRMFVSLVGAQNVNKIHLAFDKDLKTNDFRGVPAYRGGEVPRRKFKDVLLEAGEQLGGFKLGSTVVLIFDAPENFEWSVNLGDKIKIGEPLGHIKK